MSKISQYPEIDVLSGNEEGIVATGGNNYKFTLKKIKALVTKDDVGLTNVDDTSDANKPISTATQVALDGKAATTHTHSESDINGLADDLANKAPLIHTHSESDVDGLADSLNSKSNVGHQHTEADVAGLTQDLAGKAAVVHQHSQNDVNGLVTTLNSLQVQLNGKAAAVHTHNTTEINDLDAHIQEVVEAMAGVGDVAVTALEW